MQPRKFPGRDEAFFFRKAEQRYLSDRVRHSGITVIKGGPRSGKSWLIGATLRQLDREWPQPLIGFCRCSAQDSDNLGRVIDDLAIDWRKRATLLDQAKEIFNQNRSSWPEVIADAVSRVIKSSEPFGPASSLVANTLKRLPGLEPSSQAPRLKYEYGQELIKALTEIAQSTQVILVLDQWEQSANLVYELEHLQNFTRDWQDWPPTHLLITIRSGSEADHRLEEFSRGQSGFVETYLLPEFEIDSNPDERLRLINYLRTHVPACRSVNSADEYLHHIKGYPAVLDNWTGSFNKERMQNLEDLLSVAAEAQIGRYPEFDTLAPRLPTLTRKLCIRLGLLPNLTEESWPALKLTMMEGIDTHCLDDLFSCKLLEQTTPPSFGHQQRSDYFQQWLLHYRTTEAVEEHRILARKLASQVREVSAETRPFLEALAALALPINGIMADDLTNDLCEAAISCFTIPVRGDALSRGHRTWCDRQQADVVSLVAIGLFNTLNDAKAEDNRPRRDTLLDELRALALAHPTEAAVREGLAMGLFNTLNHAKAEDDLPRRDALLDELRALALAHPTEAAVRERLEGLDLG